MEPIYNLNYQKTYMNKKEKIPLLENLDFFFIK